MPIDNTLDSVISHYLKNKFRTLGAHLPRSRKVLSELLQEDYPEVLLHDGSQHFFQKKELARLAQMLSGEEPATLRLPMILEVKSNQEGVIVHSETGTEAKIFTEILGMPVSWKEGVVMISRAQLAPLRKVLKTSTVYVFAP
jgi:uncharacterized protein (UPF0216 family)